MNKRKAKKLRKKQDMFVTSFASSYREVRELDRAYHEFVVAMSRIKGDIVYDHEWIEELIENDK